MKTSSTTQRLQELLPRLFEKDQQASGERYLWFEITPNIKAAISLTQVWEAISLPATSITPIPQMPSYLLGWSNGRDRVYCVLNLQEFLGLETGNKIPQTYPTIVVQISQGQESLLLGLTVHRILRTVMITSEEILSPVEEFPSELTPYLKGYFLYEQQAIALLDLASLKSKIA